MSRPLLALLAILLSGCTDHTLDGLFWENEGAYSIDDYHGLPLYQGAAPPVWHDEDSAERRLYIEVPSGLMLSDAMPPASGEFLHAVFIPAPSACPVEECPLADSGVTFLYQHGNSGDLFRYWYRAVSLWTTGANVLIYTYRGFGISSGDVTRANVLEDAETAMTYLLGRSDVDPTRIIPYGYSTGAIPSSWLAAQTDWAPDYPGLVLESALDSIESVLAIGAGTEFPEGVFLDTTPFDGPVFLDEGDLTAPVLHLWGAQDTRVYREQTERYLAVLHDHDDYTYYIGEDDSETDEWMEIAGHRNVPNWPFAASMHISDYWEVDNPSHCCIHPYEFGESQYESFLEETGKTTGADMAAASQQYRSLISDWVLERVP